MGKIGNYDYPETRIEECLRIAGVLVNEFPNGVNDINAFATAIGHKSANSGGYLVKVADVRKYNLMDKRTYKSTHLADIIANPKNDSEKEDALNKMVFGISLFKLLHDRLRTKSPTVEQLRTQLIDLTSDRNTASKDAEKIRKVYISAMSHIRNENNISQDTNNEGDNLMDINNSPQKVAEDTITLRTGKTNLTLEKNDANISVLISVLTNLKSKKK